MDDADPIAAFAETLHTLRENNSARLSATLKAANLNGWTLQALGDMLGMSRQGIHSRINQRHFCPAEQLPFIPPPPPKMPPAPPPLPPKRLTLKPEVIARLQAMAAVARTVNGAMHSDHPHRRTSEELSEMLAHLIDRGVSRYYLARVLGCTTSAISLRLARHGFPTSPGYRRLNPPYRNTTTHESIRQRRREQQDA